MPRRARYIPQFKIFLLAAINKSGTRTGVDRYRVPSSDRPRAPSLGRCHRSTFREIRLLDGRGKAGFSEQDLGPGTVNLHFYNVMYVRGHNDFTFFAALDFERIERVNVSLRVDYPPGRGRCIRHLEVGRYAQNAFAVLDRMSNRSGVRLGAF